MFSLTRNRQFHTREQECEKVPCPLRTWTFTVSCLCGWCLAIPLDGTRLSESLRPFYFCLIMKKLLTLIFLSMIVFNAIHAENTWTLSDDGILTISGTGMPYNYNCDAVVSSYIPWYSKRDAIKKVIIENGVSYIGINAFIGCSNLTSVTIPNSVTSIGEYAFYGCI